MINNDRALHKHIISATLSFLDNIEYLSIHIISTTLSPLDEIEDLSFQEFFLNAINDAVDIRSGFLVTTRPHQFINSQFATFLSASMLCY